jgi:DNA-binding beta-propeller fold protein YncE
VRGGALLIAAMLATPASASVELPRLVQLVSLGYIGDGEGDVSPDDEHLYVTGRESDSVLVFDRDPVDGSLTLVQTLTDGSGGVDGLDGAVGVAVSPDGAHVYVSAIEDDSVATFARDAITGMLTFVEVQRDGVGGVDGLANPLGVALSADGLHVYVTGVLDDAVAVFSRNGGTGALTFVEVERHGVNGVQRLNGPEGIVVAPDGGHVYVASNGDFVGEQGVVTFARNPLTGALTYVDSTPDGRRHLAISPDGLQVYALQEISKNGRGLVAFARDPGTGLLTTLQAMPAWSGNMPELVNGNAIAVTAGGDRVYVAQSQTLVQMARDVATGLLTLEYTTLHGYGGSGFTLSEDGLNQYQIGNSVRVTRLRTVACSATPAVSCRPPAQPGVGQVAVTQNGSLKWKWVRGSATLLADFGDPFLETDYALCVYDAAVAAQPRLSAVAPADGYCGKTCWSSIVGYKFRDRRRTLGVGTLRLLDGADEQAKIIAKAGGPSIDVSSLPLVPPVTVQLQHTDGGCWQATYSTPLVNDGLQFRATAD